MHSATITREQFIENLQVGGSGGALRDVASYIRRGTFETNFG